MNMMTEAPPADLSPSEPGKSSQPLQPRIVNSAELLQGDVEVWIDHQGQLYRLRRTRSGKLILQK